tara:strand:- start:289 stop:765 length:477 start_codon:yes stop_codon:yes gene_type:complete
MIRAKRYNARLLSLILNENLYGINRMAKTKGLSFMMLNNIKITIDPKYVPERSSPTQSYFLFSYRVMIENRSSAVVRLISRYWHITDGVGNSEDIYGPGVVGKKPILEPGTSFEYTSFCPLKTPMGHMEGSYRMVDEEGKESDVTIPKFRLLASQVLN